MVTGQVVDTITNIKTVKLFAHANHEERAAIDAVKTFRERALDYGSLAAAFRICLISVAGMVPVLLIGGTLWFWSRGGATPGDVVAAGAISMGAFLIWGRLFPVCSLFRRHMFPCP